MTKEEIFTELSKYNNFTCINKTISNISIQKLHVVKDFDVNNEEFYIYSLVLDDDILLTIGLHSDDITQDVGFNLYFQRQLMISDFKTLDWLVKFIISTQTKLKEKGL